MSFPCWLLHANMSPLTQEHISRDITRAHDAADAAHMGSGKVMDLQKRFSTVI